MLISRDTPALRGSAPTIATVPMMSITGEQEFQSISIRMKIMIRHSNNYKKRITGGDAPAMQGSVTALSA